MIKGNYSEINALYHKTYHASGVDADRTLDTGAISRTARELAWKYHTVILASGKTDIVTDGVRMIYIRNGTSQLSAVTGTGCMLGALCGTYLSTSRDMDSAVCACAVLGICGQLAETDCGNGTFSVNLMDGLSTLSNADFETYLNLEEIEIEDI